MLKKYIPLTISPIITAIIYFLMVGANYFGIGWHNNAGRHFYYIYMLFYLFCGIFIVIDLAIDFKAKGKSKLMFMISRLILVAFITLFAQDVFTRVSLGKQLWIVLAGIHLTMALVDLFEYKQQNKKTQQ